MIRGKSSSSVGDVTSRIDPDVSISPHPHVFSYSVEIINNQPGEDARPIIKQGKQSAIVGVFDGLGGAGGRRYSCETGEEGTEASIASLSAGNAVRTFFQQKRRLDTRILNPDTYSVRIGEEIERYLSAVPEDRLQGGSLIKGSLIRKLPSTMALAHVYKLGHDKIEVTAFWAGDSRCYAFSPSNGLQQLTRDDLRSDLDSFESLFEDSPMSNFINASQRFFVNCHQTQFQLPLIVFCATDGCFGYVHSPPEFEMLLLETLNESTSYDDWRVKTLVRIGRLTGDDATLAMIGYGWQDFAQIREAFAERLLVLSNQRSEAAGGEVDDPKDSWRRWWINYKDLYESNMPKPKVDSHEVG